MQRYVFYWKRKNPFPKSVISDKNREWKWPYMWFTFKTSYCSSPKHIEKQWHFTYSFPKTDTNDKNREWKWPYMWFTEVSQVVQERAEGPKAPTALSGRVELTCES